MHDKTISCCSGVISMFTSLLLSELVISVIFFDTETEMISCISYRFTRLMLEGWKRFQTKIQMRTMHTMTRTFFDKLLILFFIIVPIKYDMLAFNKDCFWG